MKYPICTLGSILNPGKYLIVSTDKEHVAEVKAIENEMKKEMLSNVSSNDLPFTGQMLVAVIGPNGELKRGIVEEKIKHNMYKVLLMDYGEYIQVNKSNIRVITNKNFTVLEPLCFILRLYGLIPTEYVYVEGTRKLKACEDWLPSSKLFIENLFKNRKKVVVQDVLIDQRTVYGDIFITVTPDKKFCSLRKLLCKNEFCAYSESAFLKLEDLSSVKKNEEIKKRMEMVEKWHKENFGERKKNTDSSPLAHTSMNPSVIDSTSDCELSEDKDNPYMKALRKSPADFSRELGIGRGKLRLLAAQMEMKKKTVGVDKHHDYFFDPSKIPETVSIGRGKFKKYREMPHYQYLESYNSNTSSSVNKEDSKNISSDEFSSMKNQFGSDNEENMLEVKNAVLKPDQFDEFSNEITEVNLLVEDDPLGLTENLETENNELKKFEQNSNILKTSNTLNALEQKKPTETNNEIKAEESKIPKAPKEKPKVSNRKRSRKKKTQTKTLKEPSDEIKSGTVAPYVVFNGATVEHARTFMELPIQPTIMKNLLKTGTFRDLNQMQQWVVPAILKLLDVVVIGNFNTGKTLSYLVPLANYVQYHKNHELPFGNGPSVVIVASNSGVCEAIYRVFRLLLGNLRLNVKSGAKIKIVLAHGNGREKEVWVELTNGCDVLISTPHCLARLLEMPILTNFERLTCLVLDEIDVISQNPFRKSVRIILEKANFATKDRHYQKILTGLRWTQSVESLVKTYFKSYILVIGSFSEAVIFKKLIPSIYLINQRDKMEKLANILKNRKKISRTLICCENSKEVCHLNDFLTKQGIPCTLVYDNKMANKLKEHDLSLKKLGNSVLIATDEVISALNIRDVQLLIHFELPAKSKTNFYLRYSTLKNFFPDKDNSPKIQDKDQSVDSQSIILIDDENYRQLPHVIDFATRIGGKIPSKILGKCEEIQHVIESDKSEAPICRNLLAFGNCRNSKNCSQRHAFVKALDSPKDLPISGWVNFVVLKTKDVSCIYAKLVEHINLDGKSFKFKDHWSELSTKISDFFKDKNNRRPLEKTTIKALCAVKTDIKGEEVFYRAKIIEYLTLDKDGNPLEVNVKLMDEGGIWRVKTSELFELPDDLSKHPPTAVDIWVVGVQPLDYDINWGEPAKNFACKLMNQKLEDNQYWSGKIILALNNTLFLDSIKRKEYLPLLKIHVFDLVVQDELINQHIAVVNNEHLPSLIKLSTIADIEVPKKGERKKEDLAVIKPQWAFFDSDFVRVTFLAAENTSTIFLQPTKFNKLLQDLEDICQNKAAIVKAQKTKTVSVGMFCLALFEDGKWNRGRVESENKTQFYIFFIDHGDFLFISKSNVIPIPEDLLLRLPSQAIECSLVGIKSEEECSLEVLREIYSFSKDGKEDLFAYIVEKNQKPSITGGRKYKLNLLNKKGISLNKMLVDRGMVRVEESENDHLKDIQVEASDDEEVKRKEKEKMKKEEEGKPKAKILGDESSEGPLEKLNDDVFKDETALDFLKEFATKFFPFLSSPKETSSKVEEVQKNVPSPTQKKVDSAIPEQKAVQQKLQHSVEKSQEDAEKNLVLRSRENVLTPQVLWCQNQLEVELKIMVGNVEDYSLECTVNNFSFRCLLGESFYSVDFKLFGSISPHMTKIKLKAFHVHVVLTKLSSLIWPRLAADKRKYRWINLDVESLIDRASIFFEKIETAKLEIEFGLEKKGIRNKNIRDCSDSDDSIEVKVDSDEGEDFK